MNKMNLKYCETRGCYSEMEDNGQRLSSRVCSRVRTTQHRKRPYRLAFLSSCMLPSREQRWKTEKWIKD